MKACAALQSTSRSPILQFNFMNKILLRTPLFILAFMLLVFANANAQSLVTAYNTTITTGNGWTTNTSTGTSSSVNYTQNGCVMGGGSAITVNTATVRCTFTGEVGMAGSNRWFDIPSIAFTNNAGGTSAGTLTVDFYNNGGGRTVSYYLAASQGLQIAGAGTLVATSATGTNGQCSHVVFTLPAITGSKVIKLVVNGNSGILGVNVQTYTASSCTTPTLTGASQSATVCAGSGAIINMTGLVASSTGNAIDYTINGVAQTQVTGISADASGNASFTTSALTFGNNGQTLQITKITNSTCNTSFTQNVTLAVNASSVGGTSTYNGVAVCPGNQPTGTVTLAGNTGNVTKWQKSTSPTFASGNTDIANTTTTLTAAEIGTVAVTTYVRAVVVNGVCAAANSAGATITVTPAPAVTGQSTGAATYAQGFATPAALTVTATGAGLAYQWYSNTTASNTGGTLLLGETNFSFTPSTATIGTTYYYCEVSGTCTPLVTSAVSGAITITPSCTAPVFSVQPTDNQSACINTTLTLGPVTADQSPSYQWYSVGTKTNTGGTSVGAANGGSTDTYTPASATAGTFFYYCVATNLACNTASSAVQVTFNATSISSQTTPAATYAVGASATALSVNASGAGLTYQWYSNTTASNTGGTLISGAATSSYTPSTTSVGVTYYYCMVTGSCGPVVTSAVSGAITVDIAPSTWLTSAAAYNGTGYDVAGIGTFFRATGGGTSTLSTGLTDCHGSTSTIQMTSSLYIFLAPKNLKKIVIFGNSGTGSTRTLTSITTSSSLNGTYTTAAATASGNLSGSQATNVCSPSPMTITFGSVIPAGTYFKVTLSGNAYIAAIDLYADCADPAFSVQPTDNQTECAGGTLTLGTVVADQSPTYQWFSNTSKTNTGGTSVGAANGGNTATFTPSSATAGTFYYYVVATNGNCTKASSAVQITVNAATAISSQTTPAASYGQGFASPDPLTVNATGTSLSYQWYSNTTASNTGGTLLSGETGSSLTPSTATIGITYYYCEVGGACPPSVTSAVSGAIEIGEACTAPVFIDQPFDFQSECTGGTVSLGPVTTEAAATYQWYTAATKTNIGGTPVTSGTGGNTDTYTPPSTTAGTYYYYVVAASGACTTASDPVEFTVAATTIVSQSTAAASYTLGASATALTVTATGVDIFYQWYSNTTASNTGGTIIDGATGDSYTPLTTSLGTTYYYCIVTGTCDPTSVTSAVSGAIAVVPYAVGDFMSKASASWELASTWNTWNGTAWVAAATFPNSATASVYISGGFTVTYPTTDRAVKDLHVLDGTLKTGTVINGANRRYIFVNGNTVEVGASGTLGSALTGDNADAICIDLRNTGTVTFTGTGGLANFGLIRYNNTSQVVIDRDITLNYHGSAFAGNAMAYYSNIAAATTDNTLTVNAGKTLTFAPWACYSATGTSGQLGTNNLIIVVNGTLTMQSTGSYYAPPKGYLNTGVSGAGKTFFISIGSAGTMNLQEFLPNSTGTGTGNTGTVSIAAGGVLNITNQADLRDANTISGAGTLNVQNGASLRIGNAAGITASGATGSIQTGVRTFSTGASYLYEGTAAQVTGDALPALVRNFTVNNSAGVSLTSAVAVDSVLTLTSGKLATGANKITINATAATAVTGSSANNYVNGNIERAVAAGASTVAFPVGDAASYAPVSLTFGAGNAAGNVTASTSVPGVAPAAGFVPTGSGISQSKYINRNWTLSTTIPAINYTATFNYINPGDVVGGANTSALVIGQNDGGNWSNPTGSSAAPTATTAPGLTAVGTFSLGETGCENVSITSATAFPAGPLCSGQTTTLTANGVAGTNAVVNWYTGPNGTGTFKGAGLTLNNAGADTYYARVTGLCGAAAETSVTVGSTGNVFSGTGNWTDNARWSCGTPPSTGDAITIAAGADATLNTNFVVGGSLTMTATSSLTVSPASTLSVDPGATANFNGQSVTFKSDATGTASLGQVNGTLSGATNVTVERYIPNNGFRSWRLLSVPTSGNGQTIKQAWQENQAALANNTPGFGTQITGAGLNVAASQAQGFDNAGGTASLLSWNGTGWTGETTTNQAIAGKKAWFLFVRGDRSKGVTGLNSDASATTLRTNGTVYTGDQVNSVGANAFALVGNVYPSAINFTGLTRTGGVTNLFYIWDSKKLNGSSLGAYQTFSGTNGFLCLLAGGSYTVGQPNTTIESGQGFFVQSTTAGTLTLKESAKVSVSNGNLGFRPSANPAKIDSRLYNTNNEMIDANAVVFDAAYSRSVDADDAPKLGNPGTNFAIETDSRILAIEGTQPPVNNDAIQFRMWNLQQQTYKFEFAVTNMNTTGLSAQLEDKYLNTVTAIDLNATTLVNFTVDANVASADANRFRIVFKQSAPLPITFISIAANRNATGVKVDWKVAAERNTRGYEVERSTDGRNFTAIGSVTAIGNNGGDLNYNFTDAGAPQTTVFYRVKSAGTAGDMKYSSIVKVGAGNVKAGYAISPNPVENAVVNLQLRNQAAGTYMVRIMTNNGQSLLTKRITHAGGNSNQLLELPAGLASGTYQAEIIAPDKTRTVQLLIVK